MVPQSYPLPANNVMPNNYPGNQPAPVVRQNMPLTSSTITMPPMVQPSIPPVQPTSFYTPAYYTGAPARPVNAQPTNVRL
jgi:hypothetical protein